MGVVATGIPDILDVGLDIDLTLLKTSLMIQPELNLFPTFKKATLDLSVPWTVGTLDGRLGMVVQTLGVTIANPVFFSWTGLSHTWTLYSDSISAGIKDDQTGGSWMDSCTVTSWDSNQICASCPDGSGNSKSSCISASCKGISNWYGTLVCELPPGPWTQTCTPSPTMNYTGSKFCAYCGSYGSVPESCVTYTEACGQVQMIYNPSTYANEIACETPAGSWQQSCSLLSNDGTQFCGKGCPGSTGPVCQNLLGGGCTMYGYDQDNIKFYCEDLPAGSWTESCNLVSWDGTELCGSCSTAESASDRVQSCKSDCVLFLNNNGALECQDLPAGSWSETCTLRTLQNGTLCASCQNANQIDYTYSCLGGCSSWSNNNGNLACSD